MTRKIESTEVSSVAIRVCAAIGGLAFAALSSAAETPHDNWPTKPIRVVIPFSAGSPEEFADFIKKDIVKQAAVVKLIGLEPQ